MTLFGVWPDEENPVRPLYYIYVGLRAVSWYLNKAYYSMTSILYSGNMSG
jgi:hypothetical protein